MIENIRARQLLQRDYSIGSHQSGISGRYKIPRRGLIGEWLLNGNALDSSGYGYNGTPTNMIWSATDKGYQTQCGSFNGSNRYILLPAGPGFSSFILSGTIKHNNLIGQQSYYTNWRSDTSTRIILIRSNGNKIEYLVNTGTLYVLTSNKTLLSGEYYNFAVSYNNITGLLSLYINGEIDNTLTIPTGLTFSGIKHSIGVYADGLSQYMNGTIQNMYLYNILLTNYELKQLYYEAQKLLH